MRADFRGILKLLALAVGLLLLAACNDFKFSTEPNCPLVPPDTVVVVDSAAGIKAVVLIPNYNPWCP